MPKPRRKPKAAASKATTPASSRAGTPHGSSSPAPGAEDPQSETMTYLRDIIQPVIDAQTYNTYHDYILALERRGPKTPKLRTKYRVLLKELLSPDELLMVLHNEYAQAHNARHAGKHERYMFPVFKDKNAQDDSSVDQNFRETDQETEGTIVDCGTTAGTHVDAGSESESSDRAIVAEESTNNLPVSLGQKHYLRDTAMSNESQTQQTNGRVSFTPPAVPQDNSGAGPTPAAVEQASLVDKEMTTVQSEDETLQQVFGSQVNSPAADTHTARDRPDGAIMSEITRKALGPTIKQRNFPRTGWATPDHMYHYFRPTPEKPRPTNWTDLIGEKFVANTGKDSVSAQSGASYLAWLDQRQVRYPTAPPNYSECVALGVRLKRSPHVIYDQVFLHWNLETDSQRGLWYKEHRLEVLGEDPKFNAVAKNLWRSCF
ncbi:hypothetical protein ACN47E_000151 [Coniothyrium glycines]